MNIRPSVRIALWIVGGCLLALMIVGGIAGVIVWRNTTITISTDKDATAEFERVIARYPPRPPLVEIGNPSEMTVRVNRPPDSAPRRPVRTLQVLAWTGREEKLVRTSAPVWLMRLSLQNLASELGIPMGPLQLSVEDVERYGPGIVLDFKPPGGGRMLVWVQ